MHPTYFSVGRYPRRRYIGYPSFCAVQHGPSDARRFVGCLQRMTDHRFPIAFAADVRGAQLRVVWRSD